MSHICIRHGTHMNESWYTCKWVMAHIWMSHGTRNYTARLEVVPCQTGHTYQWVTAHMYEWVMDKHMNESWRKKHVYYTGLGKVVHCLSYHMWMSYGTRVNESWHTCEWVMTQSTCAQCRSSRSGALSVISHVDELWRTCKWVMAHIWMSHGTKNVYMTHTSRSGALSVISRVNALWHTCNWVMAHIWISHGTKYVCMTHTSRTGALSVVSQINTSKYVMAHIWMRRGTHMN